MNKCATTLTSIGLLAIFPFCIGPQVIQMQTRAELPVPQIAGHRVLRSFGIKELECKLILAGGPSVIFQESTGIFWFGGPHGLCSYDEKEDRWTDRSRGREAKTSIAWIKTLATDKQGKMWARYGFATETIAFSAGNQWRNANELRPSNITSLGRTLIVGRNGTVWFVSPEGMIGYDGSNWPGPFNPPAPLLQKYYRFKRIYGDKDLAELADIQERMRKRYGEEEPRPSSWTAEIYSGIQDRDGDIWLGATKGIWTFQKRTGAWRVYPTHGLTDAVSRIFEDRYGRIWFADSDAHLVIYDKHNDAWTSYNLELEDAVVEALYVDRQGQVIIGTDLGIIILDERIGKARPLTTYLGGSPMRGISAISTDNQGRIWLGTAEAIVVLQE